MAHEDDGDPETVLADRVKLGAITLNEMRARLGLDPYPNAAADRPMALTATAYGRLRRMAASITTEPANSLGISDVKKGVVPESIPESGIAATESCILVACYPEIDGETKITLGPAAELDPEDAPAFDGQLETPSCIVRIVTSKLSRSRGALSKREWVGWCFLIQSELEKKLYHVDGTAHSIRSAG